MTIAQGVFKQTRFKRQTAKGALAGVTGGQILRRNTSTFELQKETYDTSSEINSTQQLQSLRHGIKQVNGAVNGILSSGTYSDFLAALLRRDFTNGGTSGPQTNFTTASTGLFTGTITRATGSFLTDGFKIGQVVRATGFAAPATANNNKNLLITNLTATVMTVTTLDYSTVVAKAAGDSITLSTPGKTTFVPPSGHTNVYYTVEEWYSDVSYSERNLDVKIASADIKLPGSGNATIDLTMPGLDQSNATTVYFTAPAVETVTDALVSASGVLYVNGSGIGTVTDLSLKIDGMEKPADGVVGSNVRPDIFRGKLMVTGSFTAYFEDGILPGLFINESDVSIISALTSGSAANADFVSFYLPKLNVTSSTPDDGETGLKRTFSFTAEYDPTGGTGTAKEKTTIYIHDSQAL